MGTIFHIAAKEKWERSISKSQYTEDSLQSEGFIHGSTAEQVVDTANKHFKGQSGLVLLKIDPSDIVSVIAYEPNAGNGETYPHIFGPIPPSRSKRLSNSLFPAMVRSPCHLLSRFNPSGGRGPGP